MYSGNSRSRKRSYSSRWNWSLYEMGFEWKTFKPRNTARNLSDCSRNVAGGNNNWEKSFDRLKALDPDYAASLLPNDFYRLTRALEVNLHTGKRLKEFQPQGIFKRDSFVHHLNWDCRCFYLSTDRKFLYHLIDYRCELMLKNEFFSELLKLKKEGFCVDYPSGKSIGYFQGLQFLDSLPNGCSFVVFKEKFLAFLYEFQSESRQYARRQDTWHWKDDRFCWIPRNSPTTTLISFDDCKPVIFDKEICVTTVSMAKFLAPKIVNFSKEEFNSDLELLRLSTLAREHKSAVDRKTMKLYKSKLFIFDQDSAIEEIYKLIKTNTQQSEEHY